MEKTKWEVLQYKEMDFGGIFIISSRGEIKNRSTGNILNQFWESRKCYTVITYNAKSYRIKVGDAQVESNLQRTVLDKPRKERVVVAKEPFTEEQLNIIKGMIESYHK